MPGYQFMGPGTHVVDRIQRSVKPINTLDKASLIHDIEYMNPNISQKQADSNMFKNIVRENPFWLPQALVIMGALKAKDVIGYAQNTDIGKYEYLKKLAAQNYKLGRMRFADDN